MRIVITGGGTGGHIYPGLAVAEALRASDPTTDILFVGGRGLEQRIVPRAGLSLKTVASAQWPRDRSLRTVRAATMLAAGTVQAAWLLTRWKPHAVLATGGYAAAPVGIAAGLMRIPLVVQEQNVLPGAANRLVARWAAFVSVAHEDIAARFPGKAVVTGVPVRREALEGDRRRGMQRFGLSDGRLTVLVLGGSLGASTLNAAVVQMARLVPDPAGIQIVHQTGKDHLAQVTALAAALPESLKYAAVAYIDDVADAYACADLVICRGGAGTLAEVTAHGLPVIAAPYPFAAAGEQDANARVLERAGAALVVTSAELDGVRLAELVARLRDPQARLAMGAASRRLARPRAAEDVADLVRRAGGDAGRNMEEQRG
ncbi:MAG TPA: undecaprenyldiphospho-muramoylpentapeptide beta-N-acetylglucosaminyltransferase [bacterium]